MKNHNHLLMWVLPAVVLFAEAKVYSLIPILLALLMAAYLWWKQKPEKVLSPETLSPEEQYQYVVRKARQLPSERAQSKYLNKANRILNIIR